MPPAFGTERVASQTGSKGSEPKLELLLTGHSRKLVQHTTR